MLWNVVAFRIGAGAEEGKRGWGKPTVKTPLR